MSFHPEKALGYARALARPRRVDTAEAEAVVDEVAAQLASFGYEVRRQPFRFSTAPDTALVCLILAAQVLTLLTLWAWEVSPWLAGAGALALLALLAGMGRAHRAVMHGSVAPSPGVTPSRWTRLCLWLGRPHQSYNIVARQPGFEPARDQPQLYLMAHWDSKSQPLPLLARMALILAAGLAAAGFAVLTLARPFLPQLTPLAAVLAIVVLLAGAALLLLFLAGPGNESPGAIDNASGAGLVLQLAEHLSHHPPALPVTVLVTGAEELGLMGALAYLQAAEQAGDLPGPNGAEAVHILNFDGVGTAGRLGFVGAPETRLVRLLRQVCQERELGLGRVPLIGALFDHVPFAERGYDAVSLVTTGPLVRVVHTPADSADKLEMEGFRKAGEVALEVIRRLEAGSDT